jgi:thioredoxin 2
MIRCSSCNALNRVPVKRLKENPICGKCKNLLDFPMSSVKVAADSFDREMAAWPETVLAYFWSKNCDMCRSVDSVVDDIAFLRAGRIKVLKVDADADASLALSFSVRSTPTFLVFRNHSQIARLDGVPRDKIELLHWIEQHLST